MKTAWFHILVSLASSAGYGSAIQEDVSATTDGRVRLWPATLYGSLEDLRERGWIEELSRAEQPDDGHGRERYYRITASGREALRAEAARLEGMAAAARARLGERGGRA